jgi:hypothetical protein
MLACSGLCPESSPAGDGMQNLIYLKEVIPWPVTK